MAERKSEDEKQRPCVRGVAHVGVEARRDEAVRRVHREVESEERAEDAEAIEADVCAKRDSQYAEDEKRGGTQQRRRGRR